MLQIQFPVFILGFESFETAEHIQQRRCPSFIVAQIFGGVYELMRIFQRYVFQVLLLWRYQPEIGEAQSKNESNSMKKGWSTFIDRIMFGSGWICMNSGVQIYLFTRSYEMSDGWSQRGMKRLWQTGSVDCDRFFTHQYPYSRRYFISHEELLAEEQGKTTPTFLWNSSWIKVGKIQIQ